LFRPEAVASQQQKFYGEILLIRPLSLALLCWLGIGIACAVLAFLLLGHYTETVHVTGVLSGLGNSNLPQATLYVPERAVKSLQRGQSVLLREAVKPQEAAITEISSSPLSPEQISAEAGIKAPGPMYKVTLSFSSAQPGMQKGTRVEAEIPVGRKPLLSWLFEQPSSSHAQLLEPGPEFQKSVRGFHQT
jgi:membrane fusion protein